MFLACVALWLPFVGRSLFIDDHAHFREAVERGLRPGTPYAQEGLGWKKGQSPGEANPPLYFYVVGAATRLVGVDTWKIHILLLPLHLFGLGAFFVLARRWTRHPLWASLLWLTTPHFWVTTNSLLLDAWLAPLFLVGLALWIDGWETNSKSRLAVGALFLGLTPLVKYTGFLAWAVAGVWTMGERKQPFTRRWLFILIPVGMMGAWLIWSGTIYGRSHLTATAATSVAPFDSGRLWTLLVFFFLSTPTAILGAAAFRPASPRDRIDGLLLLWIAVGLAGLLWARGWVCARYFVIVGPAAVLLSVRAMERVHWAGSKIFRAATLGLLATGGAAVAAADFFQARVDFLAARDLEAARKILEPNSVGRYPGALLSGLSYYLPDDRWKPINPGETPAPGEVAALPGRQLPKAFRPNVEGLRPAASFIYRSPIPIRLQDGPTGAGWYGSIWGKHPLSFSMDPVEVYFLLTPPTADTVPTDPLKS